VSLNCPRCRLPLSTATITTDTQVLLLDTCQRCGGIWVDATDRNAGVEIAEHVATVDRQDLGQVGDSRAGACPQCGETMETFAWDYSSPVMLDECPRGHGTWVDGGEAREARALRSARVLSGTERARLEARLAMDSLEVRTVLLNKRPMRHPVVNVLRALWSRFE
jgi:Zn-finger nucleic acid-binding protein